MGNSNKILSDLKKLAGKMTLNNEVEVYLFGSRARGDAGNNSDWDILIVVNKENVNLDTFNEYGMPYAEIGWKYGQQITPICYTKEEWEKESNSLFYHNVLQERIQL